MPQKWKKNIFCGPEFIHGTLSLIVYCSIRWKKKKDVLSKIHVLSWVLCNLMITTTCTMQGRNWVISRVFFNRA